MKLSREQQLHNIINNQKRIERLLSELRAMAVHTEPQQPAPVLELVDVGDE